MGRAMHPLAADTAAAAASVPLPRACRVVLRQYGGGHDPMLRVAGECEERTLQQPGRTQARTGVD